MVNTASNGYSFSETELKLLTDSFTALGHATGTEVALKLGHGAGFAGVTIEVTRPKGSQLTPIVHIQSVALDDGNLMYCPTSCGDSGSIGPQLAYSTLADAVKYAAIFARAVIDVDRRNDDSASADNEQLHLKTQGKVLTGADTVLLDFLAKEVGKLANAPGWMHIDDGFMPNAACASVGYSHKGEPVALGSFVITRTEPGETYCSIRGIDKRDKLPGPDYYPSLSEAVKASIPYFSYMAKRTSDHLNRPWWKRLF